MQEVKSQLQARRCSGVAADRRGSAIVLVLVSVVLMAIIAGSLLQLTRFERIPQPSSNIEAVIESVINEILNQATDDVLDNNGNVFNVLNTTLNGGGDEPWDFAYTNPTDAGGGGTFFGLQATLSDGSQVSIMGGSMDDTWLAGTAPDYRSAAAIPANTINGTVTDSTNGIWRKITSLTGIFLGGTGGGSDLSTQATPTEYPRNNASAVLNRDFNIATNHISLVDADGDGIGDSRWEWAPLQQIGSTQYVMAVRIIDLSARLDVNVATGTYNGGTGNFSPSTLGAGLPRGDGPGEITGDAYIALMAEAAGSGITGANARAEWRNLLGYRLTGNTASSIAASPGYLSYDGNTNPATAGSRYEYWRDGASRVSNSFDRNGESGGGFDYSANATFGLNDAFELLYQNGLGSSNQTTLEDIMPDTLRAGVAESNFISSGTVTANGWSRRQFWELDPRKHLSPFTGSNQSAPALSDNQQRFLKLDVNEAVKTVAGRDLLRDAIAEVFNAGNTNPLVALFPGYANSQQLARQLAANIADYIDEDNALTVQNQMTGFEALPFITEVYTQRLYQAGMPTPPTPPATDDTVPWTQAGNQGYALEIGNPFGQFIGGQWVGRPIKLTGVWLKLNGVNPVELSSYGPSELQPGEVLILYRDSTGNTADAALDNVSNLYTATESGNMNVFTAQGPALDAAATSQNFTLHAQVQQNQGNPQGWAYSQVDFEVSGASFNEQVTPGSVAAGHQGYVITNYQGVGQGIRMMTVTAGSQGNGETNGFGDDVSSLNAASVNSDNMSGAATRPATPLAALGDETKPNEPTGYASLGGNTQQIVWPDNPRGRMHWIGDILQIPIIGPDRPNFFGRGTLMADAFGATGLDTGTGGIDALLLPYKRQGANLAPIINNNQQQFLISGRYGVYNLPHALMLLERLTTFSPATDGEDGDGQSDSGAESVSNPDDDEVLVPGKINLNTATRESLVRALPFPQFGMRDQVASAIIRRREALNKATLYGMGANNVPGIAYVSELYEQVSLLGNNPSTDGVDTRNLGAGGVRVDFNDFESAVGTFPAIGDGIIDDREEQIMLAKWLSEVGSTRSDIFAAYIVVQGYPAGSFDGGVTESAQLIIIFSRANIEGAGDRAVELGRLRIQ